MNDDKSLSVGKKVTIYQREELVDKIRFIIPQMYEEVDLSTCKLILKYKNPIGEPKSEILKKDELYKNNLQYILPIDTKLTQLSGDIVLRLTFIRVGKDGTEENILHTGQTTIHVIAVDDWYQYIPDNSLEIIDNLIIKNEKQIQELKKISTEYTKNKADGLAYENGILQLLANGEKIGNSVLISIATDESLTNRNMAADAKAVGDKIQEIENKKLDKNLGKTYANKILGIGADGNVIPVEVASGGGDGIAIINTMSGESPLVIPDSAERVNKRLELGGKTEQVQTSGKNLANANVYEQGYLTSVNAGDKVSLTQMQKSFTTNMEVSSMQGKNVSVSVRTKEKTGKKYVFTDETDTIITGVFDTGSNNYSEFKNITIPKNAKKLFFSVTYDAQENTELQVELGTTVTTYEPYTGGKPSPSPEYPQEIKNSGKWNEGTQKYEIVMQVKGADTELQSLTLTSDRPITKWDKLVEQGGQIGWLYKNAVVKNFNGDGYKIQSAGNIGNVNKYSIVFPDALIEGRASADIYVDRYRGIIASYAKEEYGICCNWNGGIKYFNAPNETVKTVDDFKKWLTENPLTIAYETESTEFVPLPQSEQNAIRALKTYYPTTVITADGGELDPDIKVTYTADTKNYIDGKVSAKVASILRQYQADTANLLSLMPMETQATMIENDTNNILNNLESEEAHE